MAREIPNAFIPNQFDNPANPLAHYKTTGKEIWKDLDGKVDVLKYGITEIAKGTYEDDEEALFLRGGYYNSGKSGGVFTFYSDYGKRAYYGFRPVLVLAEGVNEAPEA